MFDAIGVSERTRKPWTVAVSFMGQVGLIGLAVMVPLVSTEGLPRMRWVSVPGVPRALPAHRAAAATTHNVVPSQMYRRTLLLPAAVPPKAVILQDPQFMPAMDGGVGTPGGFGGGGGSGQSVIDNLVASLPAAAPPPPAVVQKQPAKAIPRINVGGDVQKASFLSGPQPVYPPLARQARISGVVHLQAIISREGTILDLRAVSGHPLLIPAAIAAVQHWVFRPTYLNGDPVEVATEIDVNFTLQQR